MRILGYWDIRMVIAEMYCSQDERKLMEINRNLLKLIDDQFPCVHVHPVNGNFIKINSGQQTISLQKESYR